MLTAYEFIYCCSMGDNPYSDDDEIRFQLNERLFKVVGARVNHKKKTIKLIYCQDFKTKHAVSAVSFKNFKDAIHEKKAYNYEIIGQFNEIEGLFSLYKRLINSRP